MSQSAAILILHKYIQKFLIFIDSNNLNGVATKLEFTLDLNLLFYLFSLVFIFKAVFINNLNCVINDCRNTATLSFKPLVLLISWF